MINDVSTVEINNINVQHISLAALVVIEDGKVVYAFNANKDSAFLDVCIDDEHIYAVGYHDSKLVGMYSGYLVKFDRELRVIASTHHNVCAYTYFNKVNIVNNEVVCNGICLSNDLELYGREIQVVYDRQLNIKRRTIMESVS